MDDAEPSGESNTARSGGAELPEPANYDATDDATSTSSDRAESQHRDNAQRAQRHGSTNIMDVDEGGGRDSAISQSSSSSRRSDAAREAINSDAAASAASGHQANRHNLFELSLGSMARVSNAHQLRPLVAALKGHADATLQLVALQELTELLSMSTEDSLIGLDVNDLTHTLVGLVRGRESDVGFATGNANAMLLACRCLVNLLEALPLSGPVLVRHDAIPVLCRKLLDIEYIDVAEQALSVLARLSEDFSAEICEAGGMSACLMFLDFFATGTQRTALACATNCARSITGTQFPQAAEAMPVLARTAFHVDQRIADLSCSAILHLTVAFRSSPERIEQLVSEELLRRVVATIWPADTPSDNSAPVALLRVLAMVASASCTRTAQLLDMEIIPALAEVLASGFGNPDEPPDPAHPALSARKLQYGSVLLVPERVWEALRLLVIVLPRLPTTDVAREQMERVVCGERGGTRSSNSNSNSGDSGEADGATPSDNNGQLARLVDVYARPAVLQQLQDALVPLMIRIFAQTSNVAVRYRVLLVVLKTVYYLDAGRLQTALDAVDLPLFVMGSVSLLESPVISGVSLLIVRVVLDKTQGRYTQRLIREGVVDSLSKLALVADEALGRASAGGADDDNAEDSAADSDGSTPDGACEPPGSPAGEGPAANDISVGFRLTSAHIPAASRHGMAGASQRSPFAVDASSAADKGETIPLLRWVLGQCRTISSALEGASASESADGESAVLERLRQLAARLSAADTSHDALLACADALAEQLTAPAGVTSHELVQSGLVVALADALARDCVGGYASASAGDAVRCLLRQHTRGRPYSVSTSALGVLLGRLQEALSLADDLRVHEAYQTGADEARSPAHMLSKQIRFSLGPAGAGAAGEAAGAASEKGPADDAVATAMEQIRRSFQAIRVSVHAVATFSVLEAYLRPRVALLIKRSSRRGLQRRRGQAAAALPPAVPTEDSDAGGLRPRRAQLEGAAGAGGSGESDWAADGGGRSKREREHMHMLRMIAQASGINLRAAALFGGVDLDTETSDSESDAGADADEQPAGEGDTARSEGGGGDGAEVADRPDDWRLGFVLRVGETERAVDASDNIFRTIHGLWQQDPQLKSASPWGHTFELRFHVEIGPRPPAAPEAHERQQAGFPARTADGEGLDGVLGAKGAAMARLLKMLYGLLRLDRTSERATEPSYESAVADLDRLFVNHTISAKAARQLSDPLMVVCAALPDWCHRVIGSAPFLVSLESRLAYLQAAFFGYSRNINFWQAVARREQRAGSSDSPADLQIPLGHVQRQKVRISRHRMLESALKVLELYGTTKTILEVEYFEEAGSGIGPTLEFYAAISRSLQETSLGLWRDEGRAAAPEPGNRADADSAGDVGYVSAPCGLFPAPIGDQGGSARHEGRADVLLPEERAVQLFGFLGRLVAKGLIDNRVLDIPLSAEFWAAIQRHLSAGHGTGTEASWTWGQIEALDAHLASSLRYLQGFVEAKNAVYARKDRSAAQIQTEVDAIRGPDGQSAVEDLTLDFTLPGYPSLELRPGGSEVPVTISNVHTYVDLVARWTLQTGVRKQIAAFCEGFDRVFSSRSLLMFTPAELCSIVGQTAGGDVQWTRHSLLDGIRAGQGLAPSSPVYQAFLDFLVSLGEADRRRFLQFATGSPRLPMGGFRALHPPMTVVPRPADPPLKPDDYLPTVMTCANLIKLPGYSSFDVLAQRWRHAISEGQLSFHLS
ncbi:Ubiquitin fusion degradation protein 4 [Coemansia biformis]|uniref:HECT-type E3 ubiquitin transferase n=1 Tax=Coemansia biformis TaxID=1286918 RepID=A0A9W7YES6_9FUNG|nr:Ubiquitin fusion degradation protein 4 [Coemansia biformis]